MLLSSNKVTKLATLQLIANMLLNIASISVA